MKEGVVQAVVTGQYTGASFGSQLPSQWHLHGKLESLYNLVPEFKPL
jgi:hypothetical protein